MVIIVLIIWHLIIPCSYHNKKKVTPILQQFTLKCNIGSTTSVSNKWNSLFGKLKFISFSWTIASNCAWNTNSHLWNFNHKIRAYYCRGSCSDHLTKTPVSLFPVRSGLIPIQQMRTISGKGLSEAFSLMGTGVWTRKMFPV